MVQISVLKNKQGMYTGFSMKGHAGYAEYGQDIVCAAVSVLVINTLNSIEQLTSDEPVVHSDENEGLIECSFPKGICDKTVLLIDSMVIGLRGIEQEYGKRYVKLTVS